ncbi:hypothetical protein N7466_004405 [Penicillium verhagenii]|uniref:uncharacterized protein n=1 Tax=Penicillium verhagenii TaxID=1562060 RepID=UPI00254595D4|nr:uncharacterized protein N7466_004405 [Penicillium verhagenii]KAJ5934858.1 hypothetical protein N7466_004405 [Penicillium verhagenii]
MSDQSKSNFKFDIAAPPSWSYDPGGVIIGHLMRYAPINSHQATVEVALVGRALAKLHAGPSKGEGDDGSSSTSQYTLLRGKPEIIFRGPVHLSESSAQPLSWPFSVRIPTEPETSVREGHKRGASFLPLRGDDPSHHVLPGTFSLAKTKTTRPITCKVEYSLEATLEYHDEGRQICRASYPVTFRHPEGNARNFYDLKTITARCRVSSQRLLPGMENADLSLKQKASKFIGSSSVPELHYELDLSLPVAIRIEDPRPFPVMLGITMLHMETSSCIRSVPQDIQISSIKLTLNCITGILVDLHGKVSVEAIRTGQFPPGEHIVSHTLKLKSAFQDLGYPLKINTGADDAPVPIGDIFSLGLRSGGLISGRKYFANASCVCPDFTTYNIEHRHSWRWQIFLNVAGENHEIKIDNPVEVLRAAS